LRDVGILKSQAPQNGTLIEWAKELGRNVLRAKSTRNPHDGGLEEASVTKHRSRSRVSSGRIWVGTSGWSYKSWRGSFFPRQVLLRHHLDYYATQFDTAELNGVFYRTPSLDAVRAWAETTPDNFTFAWKASKFITHWKRLSDRSRNSLALIEERLAILGAKAGPVLFQLPPHFEKNEDRLRSFIRLLARRRRYAFEFRHASWYDEDIFAILKKHHIALCLSDHEDAPAPWKRTADFIYVRGHGPQGNYKDAYSDVTLCRWATHLRAWRRAGYDVFVYFDNDQKSAAPFDAKRLLSHLRS
jgi:uncharacterized protein YecE (DUF72 family)